MRYPAAPSTLSTAESRPALLIRLGSVEYGAALSLQHELHRARLADEIPDTLLLLEHPPVITIGRAGNRKNLLVSEEELARQGIKLFHIERGGDITYHGPGQLLGYTIFQLPAGLLEVRRFVLKIEQALIRALGELGLAAGTRPKSIGVWVNERKIASIGIAVRAGVTLHGFALNVKTDLTRFQLLNPCGLPASVMTSIQKENGTTDLNAVAAALVRGFEKTFGLRFQRKLPRSLTSATNRASISRIISASRRR